MKPLRANRNYRRITTVVIGGGQAGLATSHCLAQRGIDHVVLERGDVANSWRQERWDSLRLLTPNWQTRLPGYRYSGDDPDGFMNMQQVTDFISGYALFNSAPLQTHTRVSDVWPVPEGYRVLTDRGAWLCRTLVIASGAFNIPVVPALCAALPKQIDSLTPHEYRNPQQLAEGGVLVVGAAATGLQIADEIQRSGRQVTLAAGEHVRMPRRYRGRDILYWMHATGLLDESHEQLEDVQRARRLPSSQLVGTSQGVTLDLNSLTGRGVKLVGRLVGIQGSTAQFSGSLANVAMLADLKLNRLLGNIDGWIEQQGLAAGVGPIERPAATSTDSVPITDIDLASGEIKTVIWATGFRPDYSWLRVPVLDRKGWLQHDGGVVAAPGLYAMGLPFMRRRKSSFIFGAGDDAGAICNHLENYLRACRQRAVFEVA